MNNLRQLAIDDANERGWVCYLSGCPLTPTTLTADHVIPKSRRGGRTVKGNVRACCDLCNKKKGSMTLSEYESQYGIAYYRRSDMPDARRREIMQRIATQEMFAKKFTHGEEKILEWSLGMTGGFYSALIGEVLTRADITNLDKLSKGFPELVQAFLDYRDGTLDAKINALY